MIEKKDKTSSIKLTSGGIVQDIERDKELKATPTKQTAPQNRNKNG